MSAVQDSDDHKRVNALAHELGCTPAQVKFARENMGDDEESIVRFLKARGMFKPPSPGDARRNESFP